MPSQNQLLEFLKQQLPAELDLLKQMVAINSFTTNKAGVKQLGKLTAHIFAPLGFKSETVPSFRPDYGDHLILIRPGKSQRTIGLISHLDTVFPPEEERRNNFSWRPEGDRIYGPGVMDIKGGTIMVHLVLAALQKFAPDVLDEITWVILLNSSEEVFSPDFGQLCIKKLGKECLGALVFESGVRSENQFCLVTARKGRAVYRVSVDGRGAHAGSHHERGANAVVQLCEIVPKVAALTDYSKELTFNVGKISGGTVINRVPHQATMEGEFRCFSMEVFREAIKKLEQLKTTGTVRAAEDGHQCTISIEVVSESPPWPRNDGTERLFQAFHKVSGTLGVTVVREERGGLSDGNFICHAVPTLDGLGPNGDNAHCSEHSSDGTKQQEFVDVASFVPKAALNVLGILELAKKK